MAEMDEGKGQGTEGKPNDAPEAKQKEPDDTVTIRKGEYSGLKTQLKQMQKQLEEYTSAKAAEEAAKLKAAQDWEALEKKKSAEVESMKREMDSMRRTVLSERARSALREAGMRAGLAVEGALSRLPTDIDPENLADWVAEIQKADPDAFGAPTVPTSSPSVGATGKPTTDAVAGIRAEWMKATERPGAVSPATLTAIKAKADAWARNHPGQKHPLT